MKRTPYGIFMVTDQNTDHLIAAMRNAERCGPFRNMTIHAAPVMKFDPAFGARLADIAASLEWAIGMADEAISCREAGADDHDTPDIIAMHREHFAIAQQHLAMLKEALA
ncbi:hypothetical protein [Sphingopyxis sp. NFH-91]|uniref:hypothetical protein n=1 Tax=Sphingopyxis sp. NFH-91 TaxID=2744457 RepID=UPI001F2C0509|nr:hypothetical protein [Sphingopyxis sp. NFH-91]